MGLEIGDNRVDGPYQLKHYGSRRLKRGLVPVVEASDNSLAYQTYTYQTKPYSASEFEITPALFADVYSHSGVDQDGNGLFEAVQFKIGLNIYIPGTFQVEGDLYDSLGNYVGHTSWSGSESNAVLQFDVANTQPPYSLEHLYLIQANGPIIDSRYVTDYQITDLDGLIESGDILFASPSGNGIDT